MDKFHYAIRLTPYPNTDKKTLFCRELIPGFINSIGGEDYLFGKEYEKNHHFHIVFSIDHEIKDELLDTFKETLYTLFEVPKKKIGNPTYSMEPVRSLDKALSYAVKDGDYECSERWQELATEAYENSHEKHHSLKSSLADISDAYIKGEIGDRQLWLQLGQSRADLGLPLSLRWVDEMTLSIQCKKDPIKLQSLWEDMEIKRQLKSL